MTRARNHRAKRAGVSRGRDDARAAAPRSRRDRAQPPGPDAPPLSARHRAYLTAAIVAAAAIVFSASYLLHDTDLWQLLVVGKAIWVRHAVPRVDEWTWVGWGDPQVTSSWLFRALIWPLWSAAGFAGLYAWRWALMLGTFALLWAAARRMGARGLVALVVVVWGALVYRIRAEVRPEGIAALLLALTLWILETRRRGGPDRTPWLVAVTLVWANAHLSWYLLFVVGAAYALDDRVRGVDSRRFRLALAASAAALFVNPFGGRALAQPFAFALSWRNEPMFRNVVELRPLDWRLYVRNGLPLAMALWPALLLVRVRRRGWDLAGMLCCAAFTALAIGSQRFVGFYAVAATPFLARELSHAIAALPRPSWCTPPWPRAAVAVAAIALLGAAEWTRPGLSPGIGVERRLAPVGAADYLGSRGVRGRMFNHFHLGGYLAYRGWPDRRRLPFATTQPENMRPADRARYLDVLTDSTAWAAFDREHRFDYVVLDRDQDPGDRLLDFLDADLDWTLVFSDDAAEVLVRRSGPLAAIAARDGYHILPAGIRNRTQLVPAAYADPALRAAAETELERQVASSAENGGAHHLLGLFRMMDGDLVTARRSLERALALKPELPNVHALLGIVALEQRRPRDAVHELERERRLHPLTPEVDLRLGQAHEALGELDAAREAYGRELQRNPASAEAQAALERLGNGAR